MPARSGTRPTSSRPSARVLAILLAVLVLVGVPALVVALASGENVTAAPAGADVPGSADARRPSAPFFKGEGDGVRPDGIGCSATPQTALRARAHLDVFVDGRPVAVPAGIGVRPTCAYWVRTTAADGVVTIGSPVRRPFTLGNLFDIWGAPLTRDRLLAFHLGGARRLRVFVDGRPVGGAPRAVRLLDGREIALVVGRTPDTLPARFGR